MVNFALSKKAEDVLLLDLRKITTMADFFIICSGTSDVQVKAIAEAVIEGAKKEEITIYHVEGLESLTWVLIDLVDIVVHVFRPDVRGYYQLERLWGDAEIDKFGDEDGG
ncbi:MAG: ribosome silencing factor [Candidatus Latescibacterota bacterium]|nr:MAG: ribosome silencing factor [Candidatus Latescibacterota bacterium]